MFPFFDSKRTWKESFVFYSSFVISFFVCFLILEPELCDTDLIRAVVGYIPTILTFFLDAFMFFRINKDVHSQETLLERKKKGLKIQSRLITQKLNRKKNVKKRRNLVIKIKKF